MLTALWAEQVWACWGQHAVPGESSVSLGSLQDQAVPVPDPYWALCATEDLPFARALHPFNSWDEREPPDLALTRPLFLSLGFYCFFSSQNPVGSQEGAQPGPSPGMVLSCSQLHHWLGTARACDRVMATAWGHLIRHRLEEMENLQLMSGAWVKPSFSTCSLLLFFLLGGGLLPDTGMFRCDLLLSQKMDQMVGRGAHRASSPCEQRGGCLWKWEKS